MIWLKQRDISNLIDMFNRATDAGDSLVAGELFDTLLQITTTGRQHSQTGKPLDAAQWKRMSDTTMKYIEDILKNPLLILEGQLILGRKVLVLIDEDAIKAAAESPIIPTV